MNNDPPIALGRKNFLFRGHAAAGENLAGLYALVATCEANEVNPEECTWPTCCCACRRTRKRASANCCRTSGSACAPPTPPEHRLRSPSSQLALAKLATFAEHGAHPLFKQPARRLPDGYPARAEVLASAAGAWGPRRAGPLVLGDTPVLAGGHAEGVRAVQEEAGRGRPGGVSAQLTPRASGALLCVLLLVRLWCIFLFGLWGPPRADDPAVLSA